MPRGMIETLCTLSLPGNDSADQRVSHLVIGDDLALMRVEQAVALFEAGDDALHRRGEIGQGHRLGAAPGREQRRLVDQVGEIGAGKARGQRRRPFRDRHRGHADLAGMHLAGSAPGRPCPADRPAPAGRSGRRAAGPDRAPRAGWSPPAGSCRCAYRSRRVRRAAGSASAPSRRARRLRDRRRGRGRARRVRR